MRKRLTPQEKKAAAYEEDHYVSGGESRHAFRKTWPKKKRRVIKSHRHWASEALHSLEKMRNLDAVEDSAIEITATQLRKGNRREKLTKWGVQSLREYVERRQTDRKKQAQHGTENRVKIEAKCVDLISAFEQDLKSPKAQQLLWAIKRHDRDLRLFLRWNPEWMPRLMKKVQEAKKLKEKAHKKRELKEAEKQRVRSRLAALQRSSR